MTDGDRSRLASRLAASRGPDQPAILFFLRRHAQVLANLGAGRKPDRSAADPGLGIGLRVVDRVGQFQRVEAGTLISLLDAHLVAMRMSFGIEPAAVVESS